jgi:hypothetical protein
VSQADAGVDAWSSRRGALFAAKNAVPLFKRIFCNLESLSLAFVSLLECYGSLFSGDSERS